MFQLYGEITSLATDESKRGGSNWGFEGRTIGPKGIIKFVLPVLP